MKKILALLLILFGTAGAHAELKEMTANEKARLSLTLSNHGANRIMVKKDRILKVIGNEDDYFIDGDLLRGHVFITPKVEIDKKIPLTLVTEKGLIQDITCFVGDIEPVSLLINAKMQIKPVKAIKTTTKESQILKVLQDITSGNTSSYAVRKLEDRYYHHSQLPIKIISVREYSNKTFKVKVLQYSKEDEVDIKELSKIYPEALAITKHEGKIIMVEKA